ncbi:ATP synthase gamma chain [Rhodospirillaceae bacterium LM-1]|nr:ATP synthase gamma chain [Rhodospirillaceae bacterium LM-1]
MANLKDLRVRITSVKSTRKITSAMKMVAASKLRRAQSAAEAARPYAERMDRMVGSLAANLPQGVQGPALLSGNGNDLVHLVVLITSDRGLCGGFNSSAVRNAKQFVNEKLATGKEVRILCVGRKGRDQLKREYGQFIIDTYEGLGRKGMRYSEAIEVAGRITTLFEEGKFDVATLIYNRFKSAISQVPTRHQMIPFESGDAPEETGDPAMKAMYEMEPSDEEILAKLLPRNLATQVFRALLESFASEQGARMTAMDNATRNAGDMLNALTLRYNRTRQANITKELIEIISGAEAL